MTVEIQIPEIEARSAYEMLPHTKRAFVDAYCMAEQPDVMTAYRIIFPHVSEATGYTQGRLWAGDALVRAAIAERRLERMQRTALGKERIIGEVAKIAFSNMQNYIQLDQNGDPHWNFVDVTEEQWAAVAELTIEEYQEGRGDAARTVKKTKLKLHPKNDGLDKLMKHFGLYAPERLEVTGANGMPIQTRSITVQMTPQQAAEQYALTLRRDTAE